MHRRVLVAVHHALGTGLGTRDGSAGDAKKGSRSSQSWGRDGARGGMELGEGWSWGRDGALLPRRAPALPGLCSVFLAGVVELLAGKPVAARVPGTGKS